MLEDLPPHLLLDIYQLLTPKDLFSVNSVDRAQYAFVTDYRNILRKTEVILRISTNHEIFKMEIFAAKFSKDKPKRLKLIESDLQGELCNLEDFAIRGIIIDGEQNINKELMCKGLEFVHPRGECSLTVRHMKFEENDQLLDTIIDMYRRVDSVPLFRLRRCIFPSSTFVERLLIKSRLLDRSFRLEDDFSHVDSASLTASTGDALLLSFLTSSCDSMSLSPTESVSTKGLAAFCEVWQRSPRHISSVSVLLSPLEVGPRGVDKVFSPKVLDSKMNIQLKISMHGRVHIRITTEEKKKERDAQLVEM